jgi:Pyruvate/2-oxoacid:ferredoxin oxidoreductase delta subunit
MGALERREQMPAHPEEIQAAQREGVRLRNEVALLRLEAQPQGLRLRLGRVVRFRREGDGRVAFEVDEGTTEEHMASFVFYAIGQMADLSFLPPPLNQRSRLQVGRFGETERPGLFAGGDIAGTYNVVNAIASAKRAVIGIDCSLRGWNPEEAEARVRLGPEGVLSLRAYRQWREGRLDTVVTTRVPFESINTDYFPLAPRQALPEWLPDARERVRTFAEVVRSYDEEAMGREAERCFHCGICNLCGNCYLFCPDAAVIQRRDWGFEIDLMHCKGCGVCVEECPRGAMAMIPEREVV